MAMPESMGFHLTSPAPGKGDPTAKNRVRGFFDDVRQSHRENRPQSLQPRQANPPATIKTASGRRYWPSRDPIGERGGVNLYGFVFNIPTGWFDYLGADPRENNFGTVENPTPPYDIDVGETSVIFEEVGHHVPDCAGWPDFQGKTGNSMGTSSSWYFWHIYAWRDRVPSLVVRKEFSTNIVKGLGLTNEWECGGDLKYKVTLTRESETKYTWKLEWKVIEKKVKIGGWIRKKSNQQMKDCVPYTPKKQSDSTEVSGDVFKKNSNP